MYTTENNAIVAALNISRSDADNAALTMLRNSATVGEIRANDKLASGTLNAYLLDAIRSGWLRSDVEAFRSNAYAMAERAGVKVNTKSNSLLTATSRAAGFCDRPDAIHIAERASTLSEALRIGTETDKANDKAKLDQEQALEALIREEQQQTERDEKALQVQRQLDDDKASGKYQADLIARISAMVDELKALGVEAEFTHEG